MISLQSVITHFRLLTSYPFKIRLLHINTPQILSRKYELDYTNVPKLFDKDLEEQFVRGSGPGGQSVNKAMNCVVLKHNPSGIVVKCHESRSLEKNRQIARQKLIDKLDEEINGESSIANQRKKIDDKKTKNYLSKRTKLNKMKEEWKKREGLLQTDEQIT